jgi:GTP-binding protein
MPGMEDTMREGDMTPLFETIVDKVPPPAVDPEGPFQMQHHLAGLLQLRRHHRHRPHPARHRGAQQPVTVIDRQGKNRNGKVLQVLGFLGLERHEVAEASAGDIVAISGIDEAAHLRHHLRPRRARGAAAADRRRADHLA